ncbi:MAG TPA: radical SAM protein [bacterium (Candidatus Stahlbacteria)]|nr:radical SAM protein [Candidatus Stahlbacteria bacterium]
MINLDWIDKFITEVKDYISVRKEDQTLILIPNQVFHLNETGFYLLNGLLTGSRIEDLTSGLGDEELKGISDFFCDLRGLIRGCVREGEKRHAIEYLPFKRPFIKLPVLSELAVTYRCNLSCRFCYNNGRKAPEVSTDSLKLLIRAIAVDAKVPSISFTGGEPTLRHDLPELIGFAKGLGLWTNLITNGTRLTEDYLKRLKRSGLDSIQISIEAGDRKTHDFLTKVSGSFDRTIIGIKSAIRSGIRVHTNTTINRINQGSVLRLPLLLRSLGLTRFSMNLMIPVGIGRKDRSLWISYDEIGPTILAIKRIAREVGIEFIWYSPTPYCCFNPVAHQLGSKSCAACEGLLSISPRGGILPCSSWPEEIGNLFEASFDRIWFGEKAERIRAWSHKSCYTCSHKEVCRGGCPLFFEVLDCELHPLS